MRIEPNNTAVRFLRKAFNREERKRQRCSAAPATVRTLVSFHCEKWEGTKRTKTRQGVVSR